MTSTTSKSGITIRLTDERWKHIVLLHPNLVDKQSKVLKTVKNPDYILQGRAGELLAVSKASKRAYLVVVYREIENDGFIITAFMTTATLWLFRKAMVWSKHL